MLSTFWFGTGERRLYGAYHEPASARPSPIALLMCQPLGQEAVRVHRIHRVLAERLARKGIGVLRFDAYATGESAGDDDDGELTGWSQDVLSAHHELTARSGARRIVWFGTRLGAWLAARASAELSGSPPASIVMWSPLTDGAAYVNYLAQHSATGPLAAGRRLPGHAIGFGISNKLESQLQAISETDYDCIRCARVVIAGKESGPEAASIARVLRPRQIEVMTVNVPTEVDWVSDEALNAALVPASVIATLEARITAEIE